MSSILFYTSCFHHLTDFCLSTIAPAVATAPPAADAAGLASKRPHFVHPSPQTQTMGFLGGKEVKHDKALEKGESYHFASQIPY